MKKYWIMGDLHGDYHPVKNFYNEHKDELSQDPRDNILILLGDVGANYFFNERDVHFKNRLEKLPFTYFCIRGNHEKRPSTLYYQDSNQWRSDIQFGNIVYVEKSHSRIYYALDSGGLYFFNDKRALILPGAYSVDWKFRIEKGWSWFPDEQMTNEEYETIINTYSNQHFDFVFSHTCPLNWQCHISDLFLNQVDQSSVDNSMEQKLDFISQKISWDRWYFGHYHADRDIVNEKATMLFQTGIPLGSSISEYNATSFDFS